MRVPEVKIVSQVIYKGEEKHVKSQLMPTKIPYMAMYEELIHFLETGKGQFLDVKA